MDAETEKKYREFERAVAEDIAAVRGTGSPADEQKSTPSQQSLVADAQPAKASASLFS
jgi:hypothetical protein